MYTSDQLGPACFPDTTVTAVPHGYKAHANLVINLSLLWSADQTSLASVLPL